MWLLYAAGSAFFAGVTSILAKCGIKKTDSTVATAVRTIVVLIFAWGMVFLAGSQDQIPGISSKTLLFLIMSGLATGASWLCYFRALQIGDVNKVVPVDKSSTVLTIILALIFFHEGLRPGKAVAILVITAGIYLMIQKKDTVEEVEKKGSSWFWYACGSAVFASLTSILGKIGINGVEFKSWDSHPYYCGTGSGMGDGICYRKRKRDKEYIQKRRNVYLLFRACHRGILALLLPCTAAWTCQCSGTGR